MKKFIITTTLIVICSGNFYSQSKEKSMIPAKEKLQRAWSEVERKKDTTKNLITKIKYLVQQKNVYITKYITIHDTVRIIDSSIQIITSLDSATIAKMWHDHQLPTTTNKQKKIFFIFRKKSK